jgi:hypothetical protein
MAGTLSLLSDDELTRLRSRVEQLMRTGTPEQRIAASNQLETIDIERERRIGAPTGSPPDAAGRRET